MFATRLLVKLSLSSLQALAGVSRAFRGLCQDHLQDADQLQVNSVSPAACCCGVKNLSLACLQGRFPSAHPVNHSPQPGIWSQLSDLARLQHAVQDHGPRASKFAQCKRVHGGVHTGMDGMDGYTPFRHMRLSPDASMVAFAHPQKPTFRPLAPGQQDLAWDTVTHWNNSVGLWSPACTYAFITGSIDGPAGSYGVSIYAPAESTRPVQTFRVPVQHSHAPPVVAWSACSSILTVGFMEEYAFLDVTSGAIVRLPMWPAAFKWLPQGSCLACISLSLELEVWTFGERAQPHCIAALDLSFVLNVLEPDDDFMWDADLHLEYAAWQMAATQDGSKVVVCFAQSPHLKLPVRVAVAGWRLGFQHPALLGQRDLPLTAGQQVDSICIGIGRCAICVAARVFVIGWEAAFRPWLPLYHILSGLCPAISPCGKFLALFSDWDPNTLSVNSMDTGHPLSHWTFEHAEEQCLQYDSCQLSWTPAGQLHLECEIVKRRGDAQWLCAVLVF